jgi:hypothetical protein
MGDWYSSGARKRVQGMTLREFTAPWLLAILLWPFLKPSLHFSRGGAFSGPQAGKTHFFAFFDSSPKVVQLGFFVPTVRFHQED